MWKMVQGHYNVHFGIYGLKLHFRNGFIRLYNNYGLLRSFLQYTIKPLLVSVGWNSHVENILSIL